MIDDRDLFERAVRRFPPPQPSFERLLKRRDRKRRNQRIGAAVLALIIAVVAIGSVISAFRNAERKQPANTITPDTVQSLKLAWKAPSNGTLVGPTVSDDVLYVASYGYQYTGGNAQK